MSNQHSHNAMLEMGHLIAAPLIASIRANFLAAKESVQCMEDYGFEAEVREKPLEADREGGNEPDSSEERARRLKMVTVQYDQMGPGGVRSHRYIKLPKLSLIPLPLLQIKDADFHCHIRAEPQIEKAHVQPQDSAQDTKQRREKYRWRGCLVPSTNDGEKGAAVSRSFLSNMKIDMKLHQSDLPVGLLKLLNTMGNNVESAEVRPRLTADLSRLRLYWQGQRSQEIGVSVRKPDGSSDSSKWVALALFGEAAMDLHVEVLQGTTWQPVGPVGFQVDEEGRATLRLSLSRAPVEPKAGSLHLALEGSQGIKIPVSLAPGPLNEDTSVEGDIR